MDNHGWVLRHEHGDQVVDEPLDTPGRADVDAAQAEAAEFLARRMSSE